nr:hypothetical protein TDPV-004 [Oriental turtle dovepox virus]WIK87675.1 hypothetical protein TDPV-377 [Oriental turtle dovepox virus]
MFNTQRCIGCKYLFPQDYNICFILTAPSKDTITGILNNTNRGRD